MKTQGRADAEVALTITQKASSSSIPARQRKIDGGFAFAARARLGDWPCGGPILSKAWDTGERRALAPFGPFVLAYDGEGFSWKTGSRARHVGRVSSWAKARAMADPKIKLLVLDELNIALRYDYLPVTAVVAVAIAQAGAPSSSPGVTQNPKCWTPPIVTEMSLVKHHFAVGVKAQEDRVLSMARRAENSQAKSLMLQGTIRRW
jgi:cob(I)alamin adenosyltransferase